MIQVNSEVGFLLVKARAKVPEGKNSQRRPYYQCLCRRCGKEDYVATSGDLNSGRIKSCGCLRNSEEHAQINITHGQRRQKLGITTKTYRAWANMKTRCSNKYASNYPWYGGRGISFDISWAKFEVFYADMGDCPEGKELDRIDNFANYSKANCRWVTHAENMKNQRKIRT